MVIALQISSQVQFIQAPFNGYDLQIPCLLGNRAVLIDAGMDSSVEAWILPFLQKAGITAVSEVIVTHAHMDHFGGLGRLKSHFPGLSISVGGADRAWVESPLLHWEQMYEVYTGEWNPHDNYRESLLKQCGTPTLVTRSLQWGDQIEIGCGMDLSVLELPAHSPGHIALYMQGGCMLFAGDVLQGRGTAAKGRLCTFPLYVDPVDYRASLHTVEDLDPTWVCTSHFGTLDRAAFSVKIKQCRDFDDELSERVWAVVRKAGEPLSLRMVADRLHATWYREYADEFQIVATIHGYLKWLMGLRYVTSEEIAGRMHWAAR